MSLKYILNIYNPTTGQVEYIEVSEDVYNEYRRGSWRIENNDRRFRAKETALSDLNGNWEVFHEFCDEMANPLESLSRKELLDILGSLSARERQVLYWLVIECHDGETVANHLGVTRQRVNQIKKRALEKLKNLAQGIDESL